MNNEQYLNCNNKPKLHRLRKIKPYDIFKKPQTRLLRTSITLPSQYNAYAVLTEFARDYFLEHFNPKTFNSIYCEGSKTFDEFRKLFSINLQMKKTNPVLAIIPTIDLSHNRNWIDTNMDLSGYLRRSRMEGTIFSDTRPDKQLNLAIQFKTILMNFNYKIRLDTKAQGMDMLEYIKYSFRAGCSEDQYLPLDIHVPKKIINQIAFDNGLLKEDFSEPKNPDEMLRYLNSYSLVPFLYKRRNATGTYEYFIRVDNCGVHIKSELPEMDDGDRREHEITNFVIDFRCEMEQLAPYCYTYYSQNEQEIINSPLQKDNSILLMRSPTAGLPESIDNGWRRIIKTEYIVDLEDLQKDEIRINLTPLIEGELKNVLEYTKSILVDPSIFLSFIVTNGINYKNIDVDWNTNELIVKEHCCHPAFLIGVYADMRYINDTIIHHNQAEGYNNPDSFRTSSRIGKIN